MRKTILKSFFTALVIMMFSYYPIQVQAQSPGISVKYLFVNYDTPFTGTFTDYSETTSGVELAYIHPINEYFNFAIPIKAGVARTPITKEVGSGVERNFGGIDAILQFQFFNNDSPFAPYIMGGVGATYITEEGDVESETDVAFPLGLGLNIKFSKKLYFNVQSEFRISTADFRNNSMIGLGLVYKFGKTKNASPPDMDGDGIIDADDKCPGTPGLADLMGCPDRDGDGVADNADDCPGVAGLAKLSGCPDADSDGIKDSDDGCPNEAGPRDNNGCPIKDADGDGVIDADDRCPNEAGPRSNNGCPMKDTDGDGVVDADDRCPNEAGSPSNNGCPLVVDSDNDGVPDKNDKCPNTAGTLANNGCPEIEAKDKEILNFAMKSIEFNTSSATLKGASTTILDQVVGIMNKYPNYSLAISGHTDSIGDAASNQKLSEIRAKSCFDYLISKGISGSRMNYVGYGETQPIADNINKAGREKNRRVEFNVYLK